MVDGRQSVHFCPFCQWRLPPLLPANNTFAYPPIWSGRIGCINGWSVHAQKDIGYSGCGSVGLFKERGLMDVSAWRGTDATLHHLYGACVLICGERVLTCKGFSWKPSPYQKHNSPLIPSYHSWITKQKQNQKTQQHWKTVTRTKNRYFSTQTNSHTN